MRARALLPLSVVLLGACSPQNRRTYAAGIAPPAAPLSPGRAAGEAPKSPTASPAEPVVARPLSEDSFFRGREGLVPWLEFVAPHAASRGKTITTTARLPQAEEQVFREAAAAGRRDVRSLFVHGVAYRVSCPPARAAEILCDPAIEKTSFAAQEGKDLGPAAQGDGRRMSFGLLDMGEKPFVYDFRFSVEATRVERPGGVFLVRTEMIADPAPERVSLVAGVAVCAPDGDGTRVSEVLAIGSSISTPFFLKGKARSAVDRILAQRANRLAAAMSTR